MHTKTMQTSAWHTSAPATEAMVRAERHCLETMPFIANKKRPNKENTIRGHFDYLEFNFS